MYKPYICNHSANNRDGESARESNMEDKIIPQILMVVSIFAVFYFLLIIAYVIS